MTLHFADTLMARPTPDKINFSAGVLPEAQRSGCLAKPSAQPGTR
jgi:hypothetical protein